MHPIHRYFKLLEQIDADAERLTALHGEAIACRQGCTSCCVNLSVFPVEFHAIRRAMEQAGTELSPDMFDPSAPCGFLHEGLCRIYPFRPIICRTHGLPILFLDDSSGDYAWEVSFCEHNFTDCESIEFSNESLLNLEDINESLSRINRDFLAGTTRQKEDALLRIPLRELSKK